MQTSTDTEIRAALHRTKLRRAHACANTLVVDELGLAHAKARIDIAVINGCVHGFEIKSAADTLARLPAQLVFYKECLEKLTIVCAGKHIDAVLATTPFWCGVIEASKGPRGAITFRTHRRTGHNQNIRAEQLAHLLWRSEAVNLLSKFEVSPDLLRQPRRTLYEDISARLTVSEITAYIREAMVARTAWRGLPAHASYDG
jgi:hypothetical protein